MSSGESSTSIAGREAEDLRRIEMLDQRRAEGGRRVIPSDVGILIARTFRLRSMSIRTVTNEWLRHAPYVVTITTRPQVLGVSGIIGADFLVRFRRIVYEFGPPDTLILEE